MDDDLGPALRVESLLVENHVVVILLAGWLDQGYNLQQIRPLK